MVGIRDRVVALAFDEALSLRLIAEKSRQDQAELARRGQGSHGIPPDKRYETAADLVH